MMKNDPASRQMPFEIWLQLKAILPIKLLSRVLTLSIDVKSIWSIILIIPELHVHVCKPRLQQGFTLLNAGVSECSCNRQNIHVASWTEHEENMRLNK